MISIDIIIVNWNAGRQLYDCLKSITAIDCKGFELSRVVVVDNASTDGSIEDIQKLGLPLTLIRNAENRGFATACNQGAKGSTTDYLLFLNPDTRLFADSVSKPIHFMEGPENEKIGICGIKLIDDDGEVNRTCARYPTACMFFSKMLGLDRMFPRIFPSHFMTEWDHNENRVVDQVMGAFFLVRRSLSEKLRGFDERFFIYFEEVDFSFRASQIGWSSFYFADAKSYHRGGGSSEQVKAKRLFYSLRSRILYGHKHLGSFSATGLTLGTLFLEPFARLTLGIVRRSGKEILETLKAYMMLWSSGTKDLELSQRHVRI
jgi:GT2 family glycosyltransferase